ncbi:MAG: diguanylate cyclase [Epsilonproteobacteria bacterium]|nr:diguanylate cyclase [Campylobacterota bacterium]
MKLLIILIAALLYAQINVCVDKSFKWDLPKPFVKKSIEECDFQNSFSILKYSYLPLIIENNLSVITGIGEGKTYIISHKNLSHLRVVANPNLPVKIFFKVIGDKVKYVNADIEDFKQGRVDAIVSEKFIKIPNAYYYDLSKLGIVYNKYYLVSNCKFLHSHREEASYLSVFFPKIRLNDFIYLTALYLGKNIELSPIYDDFAKELITKKLRVALTPFWPPFDMEIDKELQGIGVDFWKLIAKKAGLEYQFIKENVWIKILNGIKEKKYDITPNTSQTQERKKYAVFSIPYVEFPFAIACKNDQKIEKIEDIKSLAVGYNYTAHKVMKAHYPNMNFVTAKSVIDAFKAVEEGKAQCVVDVLPTVVWLINQNHIGDMRVFFKTPFTFKLQVMLRKDLVGIRDKINKAINEISVYEKNRIISKYIGEPLENRRFPYKFIIILLVVIIAAILYKVKNYKKKSEIDGLTQIYNRHTVEEIFKELIREKSGSVIFFDIDHFKKINDTHGHDKGDEVLKKLAKIVKEIVGKNALFGRWGGEEFVLILPEIDYYKAILLAEQIRKKIENTDFGGLKVTISLGVSDFKAGERVDDVMLRADVALYSAKEEGRNQVKGIK